MCVCVLFFLYERKLRLHTSSKSHIDNGIASRLMDNGIASHLRRISLAGGPMLRDTLWRPQAPLRHREKQRHGRISFRKRVTPACRCQEFALASGRPRPRVLCALVPLIQERGTYGTPREFAPPPLVEVLAHTLRSFFMDLHP